MEALQRVYGVSFPDVEMMAAWAKSQQEARSRDHRRIGKVSGAGQARPGGGCLRSPWPSLSKSPFET